MNHQRDAYQKNLIFNLNLSGPGPTFFAQYQSDTIAHWCAHLLAEPITIVDVGCGDGVLTSFIAALFYNAHIHGVDTSAEHIDVARMAYPAVSFEVAGDKLPFPDASVDLIIMADTLHHIPVDKHGAMISEIMRILKPGGICCILEPNPYNLLTRYRFTHDPMEESAQMIQPRKLKNLVQPYGNTHTVFYHFFPQRLQKLRFYEKYLSWVPFGQLYACITTKK